MVIAGNNPSVRGDRLSSTEVLDVNTMTWGIGQPLPRPDAGNRGMQSGSDTYLGFSTGGNGNGRRHSKIYGLIATDENGLEWEEVHSMTTARSYHSAVNAPKSLLPNC